MGMMVRGFPGFGINQRFRISRCPINEMNRILWVGMISILVAGPCWGELATKSELAAQNLFIDAVGQDGSIAKIDAAESAYRMLGVTTNLRYQLRIAALTAARAWYKYWPPEKLGVVNDAIQQFDQIEKQITPLVDVNMQYEFHLYRGRTYINFPTMLGKRSIAMADFKMVAALIPQLNRSKSELGPFYLEYARELRVEKRWELAKKFTKLALENSLSSRETQEAMQWLSND